MIIKVVVVKIKMDIILDKMYTRPGQMTELVKVVVCKTIGITCVGSNPSLLNQSLYLNSIRGKL